MRCSTVCPKVMGCWGSSAGRRREPAISSPAVTGRANRQYYAIEGRAQTPQPAQGERLLTRRLTGPRASALLRDLALARLVEALREPVAPGVHLSEHLPQVDLELGEPAVAVVVGLAT